MRTGRNVNVDPLAPAQAVLAPQIKEILSLRTGKLIEARRFISRRRHEDLVRVRNIVLEAMLANRPRLVCPLCQVPVYIVASPIKAFFFRHRSEDGSCPAVTRSDLTEDDIRARKYAGVQESEPHKRLKSLLARSINADPRFHDLALELTWRGSTDVAARRRPDVATTFGELRIAFEAQLSTTFVSVVVARRTFYRAEGALLVWVLASFDPDNRRMTEDDILFPNNSNVLVVDDETAVASQAAERFLVKCWHRRVDVTARRATWILDLVGFDELTLDLAGQRAFLVDVEGAERAARAQAEADRLAQAAEANETLRSAFLARWMGPLDPEESSEERETLWRDFIASFRARGIDIPRHWWGDDQLDRRLKLILSAKSGSPVRWGFKRLPEIAHFLHDKHPELLLLFGHLLRLYGHDQTLREQDKSGGWARKAGLLRREIEQGSLRYIAESVWPDLLAFLFPEAKHLLIPRGDGRQAA